MAGKFTHIRMMIAAFLPKSCVPLHLTTIEHEVYGQAGKERSGWVSDDGKGGQLSGAWMAGAKVKMIYGGKQMKRLLLMLALLLLPVSGWGNTKYVALDGSDANPGSDVLPYKTIEYAIESGMSNGDTLVLMCNTDGSGSPCIYGADNFWKSGSDKLVTKYSTTCTIQEASGKSVTLNIPSDAAAYTFRLSGTWVFNGIDWTNTNGVTGPHIRLYPTASLDTSLTFQNGSINLGTVDGSFVYASPAASTNGSILFDRMKIKGVNAGSYGIVNAAIGTDATLTTTVRNSLLVRLKRFYVVTSTDTHTSHLYMYNNTIANCPNYQIFNGLGNQGYRVFKNNIFRGDSTFYRPIYSNYSPAVGIDAAKWVIKNNVFYHTSVGTNYAIDCGLLVSHDSYGDLIPDDTNYYFDPQFSNELIGSATGGSSTTLVDSSATFTSQGLVAGMEVLNTTTGSYSTIQSVDSDTQITLASSCTFATGNLYHIIKSDSYIPTNTYLSGRGSLPDVPSGGDITGGARPGADIGAWANPSGTVSYPSISANTIAVSGDSLAQSTGAQIAADNTLYPITAVGYSSYQAAIGGTSGFCIGWYVDRVAINWHPQYIVFLTWNNNFKYGADVPTNITHSNAVDMIEVAIAKARYWGMTPLVLNMSASTGTSTEADQIAESNALDAVLEPACNALGVPYANFVPRMQFNATWANAYNNTGSEGYFTTSGLLGDVHPSTNGYRLIASVVKDLVACNQDKYYVSSSGTSVPSTGSKTGAGTSLYPINLAAANAISLPTGATGKTVMITEAIMGTFTPVADGKDTAPMKLSGYKYLSGGYDFTGMNYWSIIKSKAKGSGGFSSYGFGLSLQ